MGNGLNNEPCGLKEARKIILCPGRMKFATYNTIVKEMMAQVSWPRRGGEAMGMCLDRRIGRIVSRDVMPGRGVEIDGPVKLMMC